MGLHTAGVLPRRLETALPHADWVGLDIKTFRSDYPGITGTPGSGDDAWESLESLGLLLASRADHEIRTTFHPDLLPPDRLRELCGSLAEMGVKSFALQYCRPQGEAGSLPARPAILSGTLRHEIGALFPRFTVRGYGHPDAARKAKEHTAKAQELEPPLSSSEEPAGSGEQKNISRTVSEIIDRSENGTLSDEQTQKYAEQIQKMLGGGEKPIGTPDCHSPASQD